MRLGWLGLGFLVCASTIARGQDVADGELLVKFKKSSSVARVMDRLGAQPIREISGTGYTLVQLGEGISVAEGLSRFRASGEVEAVEPNGIAHALFVPNDQHYSRQWGAIQMQLPEGWDQTQGSTSVVIAIIDTGIDLDHPDLNDKIVAGYDFVNHDTVPQDDHYHGTHCAGIAAAETDNRIGVAGVGFNCRLMPIKVLDRNGSGTYAEVAEGVTYAADHGAKVISMSLGGSEPSSALSAAINYAWNRGVVVVAAAGNYNNTAPVYPAYYTNCIAVAATEETDHRAAFSTYGTWVDVAAPGNNIPSTIPDGYALLSGTSMAAPAVAGLVGLTFSKFGVNSTPAQIRKRIEDNCDAVGTWVAKGRVNARKTLTLPVGGPTLSGFDVAPSSLVGPGTVRGTLTISASAPAGGFVVTLASTNPSVLSVPTTATVPVGAREVTVNFAASTVQVDSSVTITASALGVDKTAVVTVKKYVAPSLSALALSQASVSGAASLTGVATLNVPAGANGLTISLSSSNPSLVSVPSSIVVPAGAAAASFSASCAQVSSDTIVTITGVGGGATKRVTITLIAAAPALQSVSVMPGTTYGGSTPFPTGTVRLTAPAPAGGAVVTLNVSDSRYASVQRTLTIPAGLTSKTFPITTYAVLSNVSVTVNATWGSTQRSAQLSILKR